MELSDLVKDFSSKLQPTDIPGLPDIINGSGLVFETAVGSTRDNSAIDKDPVKEHLTFVYRVLQKADPEVVKEAVYLQTVYEIIHTLRLTLQKKFAYSVMGDREEIKLQSHEGYTLPSIKVTRRQMEKLKYPGFVQDETELGYRYTEPQHEQFKPYIAPEIWNANAGLLDRIQRLRRLEIAYSNTMYGLINKGERDLAKIRTAFQDNIAFFDRMPRAS